MKVSGSSYPKKMVRKVGDSLMESTLILIIIFIYLGLYQNYEIANLKWHLNNAREDSKRYFDMYLECSKDFQTLVQKEMDK